MTIKDLKVKKLPKVTSCHCKKTSSRKNSSSHHRRRDSSDLFTSTIINIRPPAKQSVGHLSTIIYMPYSSILEALHLFL